LGWVDNYLTSFGSLAFYSLYNLVVQQIITRNSCSNNIAIFHY